VDYQLKRRPSSSGPFWPACAAWGMKCAKVCARRWGLPIAERGLGTRSVPSWQSYPSEALH
jgi:hypothetical protein